jgi:hypothetical protein
MALLGVGLCSLPLSVFSYLIQVFENRIQIEALDYLRKLLIVPSSPLVRFQVICDLSGFRQCWSACCYLLPPSLLHPFQLLYRFILKKARRVKRAEGNNGASISTYVDLSFGHPFRHVSWNQTLGSLLILSE